MSLTPQTFAQITAALARSLDANQLAAAVGALAPLVTADSSAFERARAALAADPTLSIGELMQTAHCSSSTAIKARQACDGAASNAAAEHSQQAAEKPRQDTPEVCGAPQPAGNGASPPTALKRAEQFLQHQLRNGARQECHLRAAAAIAKISPAVLDKAAEYLDIRQSCNGADLIWHLPTPVAVESASGRAPLSAVSAGSSPRRDPSRR